MAPDLYIIASVWDNMMMEKDLREPISGKFCRLLNGAHITVATRGQQVSINI